MYPFHQYLKMCRKQKGLHLSQASKALDISESLLYQYETNKSFPNGKNLIRLARFYNFSLDTLFDITPHSETVPQLYNPLGQRIEIKAFPWPDNAAYYQLSEDIIVLVRKQHAFQPGQSVLAFFNGRASVFYVTYYPFAFYLLNSEGKLFSFQDKNIEMIGVIIQYLKLVSG